MPASILCRLLPARAGNHLFWLMTYAGSVPAKPARCRRGAGNHYLVVTYAGSVAGDAGSRHRPMPASSALCRPIMHGLIQQLQQIVTVRLLCQCLLAAACFAFHATLCMLTSPARGRLGAGVYATISPA